MLYSWCLGLTEADLGSIKSIVLVGREDSSVFRSLALTKLNSLSLGFLYKIRIKASHPVVLELSDCVPKVANRSSGTLEYFCSQSCMTPCDPMYCSMPGFPVLHRLREFAQTHVHWVGDAILPSRPLSPTPTPLLLLLEYSRCLIHVRLLVSLMSIEDACIA